MHWVLAKAVFNVGIGKMPVNERSHDKYGEHDGEEQSHLDGGFPCCCLLDKHHCVELCAVLPGELVLGTENAEEREHRLLGALSKSSSQASLHAS